MKHLSKCLPLALAGLLALAHASAALAYSEMVNDNYVGSDHAIAFQDTYPVAWDLWGATIRSTIIDYRGASPGSGQAINVIGHRYWTIREICNGQIVDQTQYSGDVNNNASDFVRTAYDDRDYCGQGHQGMSLAKHDFNHTGSENWTPEFSDSTAL